MVRATASWRGVLGQAAVIAVIGSAAGLGYNLLSERGVYAEAPAGGEIGLAEAKRAFDGGAAVFVDARFEWDFDAGHVPGARSVPVGQFSEQAGQVLADLARDTWVITYCTGEDCHSSQTLARLLCEERGFTRVQVMASGWPGWVAAGYPVDGGER